MLILSVDDDSLFMRNTRSARLRAYCQPRISVASPYFTVGRLSYRAGFADMRFFVDYGVFGDFRMLPSAEIQHEADRHRARIPAMLALFPGARRACASAGELLLSRARLAFRGASSRRLAYFLLLSAIFLLESRQSSPPPA